MTSTESDYVKLSVQGSFFSLKKSMILAHEWILSKIVTSDIHWEQTSADGQIYLDVDPSSFGLVLAVIKGTFSLESDSRQLSSPLVALMKTTARYLMLDDIVGRIEEVERGHGAEMKTKEEEIERLEHELGLARRKVNEWERVLESLEKHKTAITVVKCKAYRTHRPYNECGCQSIIIGPLTIVEGDNEDITVKCECGDDCSRLWNGRIDQFTETEIEADDLLHHIW